MLVKKAHAVDSNFKPVSHWRQLSCVFIFLQSYDQKVPVSKWYANVKSIAIKLSLVIVWTNGSQTFMALNISGSQLNSFRWLFDRPALPSRSENAFIPDVYNKASAPNSFRGAVFIFRAKIGLRSIKNVLFCILFSPMGAQDSPALPLATLLIIRAAERGAGGEWPRGPWAREGAHLNDIEKWKAHRNCM